MAYQWVERRPALDFVDGGDSTVIGGVGAETVDGFRGERDELSGAQELCSPVDLFRVDCHCNRCLRRDP
jgi:hypothetical protein